MKTAAILCSLAFVFVTGCSTGAGSSHAGHTPSASPTPTNPVALACRLPITSPTNDGEAPDGATYVVHDELKATGFYLVDARTGAQRLILSADGPAPAPGSWQVVEWAREGIYLWSVGMLATPGLWLLDPQTGNVRLVDGSHYWSVVAGRVAWAIDQPRGADAGTYNALYRLDLASGQVSTWYETKGNLRLLTATPAGEVLITEGDGYGVPNVVRGPNQISPLVISPDQPAVGWAYSTNPGIWLSLQGGGLALYIKGAAATVVSRSPDIFNVAGGCW
jgi:hypothetical protein